MFLNTTHPRTRCSSRVATVQRAACAVLRRPHWTRRHGPLQSAVVIAHSTAHSTESRSVAEVDPDVRFFSQCRRRQGMPFCWVRGELRPCEWNPRIQMHPRARPHLPRRAAAEPAGGGFLCIVQACRGPCARCLCAGASAPLLRPRIPSGKARQQAPGVPCSSSTPVALRLVPSPVSSRAGRGMKGGMPQRAQHFELEAGTMMPAHSAMAARYGPRVRVQQRRVRRSALCSADTRVSK